MYIGDYTQIEKVRVDILDISTNVLIEQNVSANKQQDKWICNSNSLIVDRNYRVTYDAYKLKDNITDSGLVSVQIDGKDYIKVYTGTKDFIAVVASISFDVNLSPIIDNRSNAVPIIKKIERPFNINKGEKGVFKVDLGINTLLNNSSTFNYSWNLLDINSLKPVASNTGSFNSQSGTVTYSNTSSVEVEYTAPENTSIKALLIEFEISNSAGIGTKSTQTLYITSATGNKAGIAGDPYITTLSGKLYKMSNFQGFSRMLQGTLNGKLITINAETRITTSEEAKESEHFVKTMMGILAKEKPEAVGNLNMSDFTDKNNAFITKLYIQYGGDYIMVDVDALNILDNKSNFTTYISKDTNKGAMVNLLKHYKNTLERVVNIDIGPLSIIISHSNNPQVRGSFCIKNGDLIDNVSGALANTLFIKDMKIKNIKSLKPIVRSIDRTAPKNTTREVYVNNEGAEYIKELPIF